MNDSTSPHSRSNQADLLSLPPYDGFLSLCKSKHTRDNYQQDLKVLKAFLEGAGLSGPPEATPEQMVRFAASLTKPGITPMGKPRGPYSTRTMKRILASTRSFYRYLASIQRISTDPTAVFHNLAIRSPQRNPRPLAPQDRDLLVKNLRTGALEDQRTSLTVLFGYHCGLRVSEIANLKTEDLDLTRGLVTVIGKGDKERIVPMTDALIHLIKLYLRQERPPSAYLFTSPRHTNKAIHPDYLEGWVKKAALWAGLPQAQDLTVHVLRHSFGTQLAESGASVYEIRDLMGHSSITVSENYVKLASQSAQAAHRKAFGQKLATHPMRIEGLFGIRSVLEKFRGLPKS
ncbi:MAG TPA: tyrosine-type recombinase/integrase [bacterium]|nr:tyrosine-type recombinase/integrase [bacterium]